MTHYTNPAGQTTLEDITTPAGRPIGTLALAIQSDGRTKATATHQGQTFTAYTAACPEDARRLVAERIDASYDGDTYAAPSGHAVTDGPAASLAAGPVLG